MFDHGTLAMVQTRVQCQISTIDRDHTNSFKLIPSQAKLVKQVLSDTQGGAICTQLTAPHSNCRRKVTYEFLVGGEGECDVDVDADNDSSLEFFVLVAQVWKCFGFAKSV